VAAVAQEVLEPPALVGQVVVVLVVMQLLSQPLAQQILVAEAALVATLQTNPQMVVQVL
jgi:hypothetical protein